MPKKFRVFTVVEEGSRVAQAVSLLAGAGFTASAIELVPARQPIRATISSEPEVLTNVPAPRRKIPSRLNDKVKVRDSHRGRVALSVFKSQAIAHGVDFEDAFVKDGYQGSTWGTVISELMEEGELIRVRRGTYRLPLPAERSLA